MYIQYACIYCIYMYIVYVNHLYLNSLIPAAPVYKTYTVLASFSSCLLSRDVIYHVLVMGHDYS